MVFASHLIACSAAGQTNLPAPATDYPAADGPGEVLQAGEPVAAAVITAQIKKGLEKRAAERKKAGNPRPYIRGAHPKAHGCLKANVQIEPTLPSALSVGVYQPGKKYCSWVRFLNSNENPDRPDTDKDGRGMAIKLLNIDGKTLLERDSSAATQDFIMISHPVFFINSVDDYVGVIRKVNSDSFLDKLLLPFSLGIRGTWNAYQITSLKNRNPLAARYWSMVPYQLGLGANAVATKFMAQPCGYSGWTGQEKEAISDPEIPSGAGPDFLRQALKDALDKEAPCMELLVQVRKPGMSVEDAKTEWVSDPSWWDKLVGNEVAPFVKIATLRFPENQNFDTPEQNLACEDMSYSPWHALPEHKPLGVLNRLRKVIYRDISSFRHSNNLVDPMEPPAFQLDQCGAGEWQ
ncbi:MAG: catalase [Rhodospirillales bacterium]|nr:catalase [Rhodospirillales bacterium]